MWCIFSGKTTSPTFSFPQFFMFFLRVEVLWFLLVLVLKENIVCGLYKCAPFRMSPWLYPSVVDSHNMLPLQRPPTPWKTEGEKYFYHSSVLKVI